MKHIIWVRENGAWVEQGDGPLTLKTAERIVRELRREIGGSYKIRHVGSGAPPSPLVTIHDPRYQPMPHLANTP